MKIIYCVLICLLMTVGGYGQSWMSIEQAPLNIKYELPHDWFVGGYMGADKCNCTGGTINTAPAGKLNMVVFYSDTVRVDSLMGQEIWGYQYPNSEQGELYKTEQFDFNLSVASWEKAPSELVLQLSVQKEEHALVLYFWGAEAMMNTFEDAIQRIIHSITLIRA